MEFLTGKFFGMAGIRRAQMSTEPVHHEEKVVRHAIQPAHPPVRHHHKSEHHEDGEHKPKRERYTGVPSVPMDIGHKSGKEIGGSRSTGVTQQAMGNPAVILGLGLTTLALLGMFKKSFAGDKSGTQKYMQYRIMAQFFTVTALVAGVTIFGGMFDNKKDDKKEAAGSPLISTSAN